MSDEDRYQATPEPAVEPCAATSSPTEANLVSDSAMAPGGRTALARGCTCSVLANAAYRASAPGETPFVDPRCPLHALDIP